MLDFRIGARFSLVILAVVLTGCSGGRGLGVENPQLVASPDEVSLMLANAADKASKSLEKLAAIEQTRTPTPDVAPISDAPIELRRGLTIEWVGPVEPLARKVANKATYSFMVLGDRPPAPVVVTLDVENRRIIDVLRDIGLQMGSRADIRVDANQRVVELQYRTFKDDERTAR